MNANNEEVLMTKRSPFLVFLLPIITFGIYGIIWYVKTKDEMNAKGANIPTAWLLIVPIANLIWLWNYGKGVEQVTAGQTNAATVFILVILLGSIGMAVAQSNFNKIA